MPSSAAAVATMLALVIPADFAVSPQALASTIEPLPLRTLTGPSDELPTMIQRHDGASVVSSPTQAPSVQTPLPGTVHSGSSSQGSPSFPVGSATQASSSGSQTPTAHSLPNEEQSRGSPLSMQVPLPSQT